MPIKVNCIHSKGIGGCTNTNIKRSLFGIGPRVCPIFRSFNTDTCPYHELSRPPPPPYSATLPRPPVGGTGAVSGIDRLHGERVSDFINMIQSQVGPIRNPRPPAMLENNMRMAELMEENKRLHKILIENGLEEDPDKKPTRFERLEIS